jgi:methylated-DNA-[protein]-cysteine S-methyltransferase
MHITIQYYNTPVGELILGVYDHQLCLADWRYRYAREAVDKRIQQKLSATYHEGEHPVLERSCLQLDEYFAGQRQQFDLPLLLAGSAFQQQVWQALTEIPFGATTNYMELSERLGSRAAIRAVAAANGANAISIVVPCHRVIGSDGALVGYAGGLKAKEHLLRLENNLFRPKLVDNPDQLSFAF